MPCDVIHDPDAALLESLAAEALDNPFWTPRYLEARRRLGGRPLVLRAGAVRCPAVLRVGRIGRALEIPSLPAVPLSDGFWAELLAWREAECIERFELNTFASPPQRLPDLDGPWQRRARREFVVDLGADLEAGLSSNHARNIKRARKSGIVVTAEVGDDACATHVALMLESLARRRQRGERVAEERAEALRQTRALVGAGAGVLYQAWEGATLCSSILVLRAAEGGYYHSAGSSAAGMSRGASHLLVLDIAARLRADGCRRFNLGGVSEPGSGLEQFKSGFGSACIELDAMEAVWPRPWTAVLRAGAARIRELVAHD